MRIMLIASTFAAVAFGQQQGELLERIRLLEERLAALESKLNVPAQTEPARELPQAPASPGAPRPLDLSLNAYLDGYYGYNFNQPVGRVNLLRTNDIASNSFNLNQATFVLERPVDLAAGRRFGIRADVMYGQAAATMQGNAQNEPRPYVFRPLFQAYGTYVFPLGNGLTVDFGKWASTLGFEGNYAKDQINYSRSFWFSFLPFYHFGFRSSYRINDRLTVTHWLVNGANQTEDFNGFKSQHLLLNWKPAASLSWNIGYYAGREQRDSTIVWNSGLSSPPAQPELLASIIRPQPRGRLHILDSYASWSATRRLTLVGEGDYVVNRIQTTSPPAVVYGGAVYARQQVTQKFSLGARFEYLRDKEGLFSGVSQALKDGTLTATYQLDAGFQCRAEYRRDWSSRPFFLTADPGKLKPEQGTATVGLIWWIGGKEGVW